MGRDGLEVTPRPRRSVIEIMILTFTFVVALFILGFSVVVSVVKIKDPSADVTNITDRLSALITGILGALLGLIAGRSNTGGRSPDEPD